MGVSLIFMSGDIPPVHGWMQSGRPLPPCLPAQADTSRRGLGARRSHGGASPPGGRGRVDDGSGALSGRLGIAVIGRNEGERLRRCLDSVVDRGVLCVYVDSGSTDGSIEMARSKGVDVVELDPDTPFTMGRGRNTAFRRLVELERDLSFVQFVDGDCEVIEGWLELARRELEEHEGTGVVCGRRSEREPERSTYNRLTDMEWRQQAGEVQFAGGDVMLRVEAFRDVGGYDEAMIAGEDPEICVRIREAGWKIRRLDAAMTHHDAAIFHFGQWWRRAVRGGHAYAEGAYLHRHSVERPWARECRSIWVWGLALPVAACAALAWTPGWSLALLALYPLWAVRIAARRRHEFRDSWSACCLYGAFCMLSKLPQMFGQSVFWWNRARGRRAGLMEYKAPGLGAAHPKDSSRPQGTNSG